MSNPLPKYPYHEFALGHHYKGRYWVSGGYAVAIVASVYDNGEWAAYIGGTNPYSEIDALSRIARVGSKLSEADAHYFFPAIDLPYRL